jgi:three-Cys-motif partner protein
MNVTAPYDLYILCERDPAKLSALRERVARLYPHANVEYILGDCNTHTAELNKAIARSGSRNGGLSFCFADPFGIGELKFATIQSIGQGKAVDFLILLALAMDANRFKTLYLRPSNRTVDEFLGNPRWREAWAAVEPRMDFRRFLAEQYGQSMSGLGYLPVPLSKMKEVRSSEKNLPLYHLAFFSQHKLGYKFWDQVLKYGADQFELFD